MEESYGQIDEPPLTKAVVIICMIAGSAGLMFGYDIAVSGEVTMMVPFLEKFFPSVLEKMGDAKQDQYCLFDSHKLTAFTSSLFIAGLASSLLAGHVTSVIGRKLSLIISGKLYLMGTALGVFAHDVGMLIMGRVFLGFGVGFANQAAPVYITEMAPPKWRGTLTTAFQFFLCLGSLTGSLINLASNNSRTNRGWQLALGCASIPAIVLTTGALFIPDTPSSLIRRGKRDEALAVLCKVRSNDAQAEAELRSLISLNDASRLDHKDPYKKLMERRYIPQLMLTVAIAVFQQLTGVGMVSFYAPVLMRTIGIEPSWSLFAVIVLEVVNLGSVLISTYMVDKIGRRFLFLQGGVQIIFSHVFIACTLAIQTEGASGRFSYNHGVIVLVLMCFISSAFGWSWAPLFWLVPSEILPTEVRAAGTGISITTNFIVTFILAQLSMAMLCRMKFGLFLFYAATTLLMTTFIGIFLPETKGVPIELMDDVWSKHWFWKQFVSP